MDSRDNRIFMFRLVINEKAKSAIRYRDSWISSNVERQRAKMRFQKPFQWKEVTQFENRLCNPPILAIRKIKTWLFKVRMRVFYGKKCKPCVLAQLYPFTLPIKALQKRKPLHKNRATCKP